MHCGFQGKSNIFVYRRLEWTSAVTVSITIQRPHIVRRSPGDDARKPSGCTEGTRGVRTLNGWTRSGGPRKLARSTRAQRTTASRPTSSGETEHGVLTNFWLGTEGSP